MESPGFWRLVDIPARWGMMLVKRSPHAEYHVHVPESNVNVPGGEGVVSTRANQDQRVSLLNACNGGQQSQIK